MSVLKIGLLGFLLLFAFGIANAQTELEEMVALDEDVSSEDLGISEPNILPDSPFYFLKNWARGVQSFFAFNAIAKAELKQKFANEKIMEVKKMIEKGKGSEVIEKAMDNYREEIRRIQAATERIRERAEENERVGTFLDKFIQQQTLHQRLLQKLEEQVPERAMERIREAREEHLERFGEVMTRLEEDSEKLKERLEKNLQEVKGSEFKEFKNMEILKELEERVPEATKEAIREARESSMLRLKTTVESITSEAVEKFQAYTETISGNKNEQLRILEELKEKLQETPALRQKIIESSEKVLERIEVKERERTAENTRACIQLWDPVCGKDGKTYSNECFAEVAGAEIAQRGVCPSPAKQQIQTQAQTQNQSQSQVQTQTNEAKELRERIEEAQKELQQLQQQLMR